MWTGKDEIAMPLFQARHVELVYRSPEKKNPIDSENAWIYQMVYFSTISVLLYSKYCLMLSLINIIRTKYIIKLHMSKQISCLNPMSPKLANCSLVLSRS